MDAREAADLYRGNNILGISLLCVSVAGVLLALFILSSFVSLQNIRTLLHKHLLVAFLFQDFLSLVLQALLYLARKMDIPDIRCFFRTTSFCEALLVLSKYTSLTSVSWLLVVVLFQWKLTKTWFTDSRGCVLVCVLAWTLPTVPTIAWTTSLALTHHGKCWNGHLSMPSIWIIEGTKLFVLFLVLVFLVLVSWGLFDRKREIINFEEVLRRRVHVRQCVGVFVWMCIGQVTYTVSVNAPLGLDMVWLATLSYIVTILMSSTGFVVSLCVCMIDADVREAMRTQSPK